MKIDRFHISKFKEEKKKVNVNVQHVHPVTTKTMFVVHMKANGGDKEREEGRGKKSDSNPAIEGGNEK